MANLSRFAQPVDLDLPELEGMMPVEMLGYVEFPPIGNASLTGSRSGPYGFFWLELHGAARSRRSAGQFDSSPLVADTWETRCWRAPDERSFGIRAAAGVSAEATMVRREGAAHPSHKNRGLDDVLPDSNAVLALVEVQYEKGDPDTYFLPLATDFRPKTRNSCARHFRTPSSSPAISSQGSGFLHDGMSATIAHAPRSFLSSSDGKQAAGAERIDPRRARDAVCSHPRSRGNLLGRAARVGRTEQYFAVL